MAKKTIKIGSFSANTNGVNIGLNFGDKLAIIPANLIFVDEEGHEERKEGVTTLTRQGYANGFFTVIYTQNGLKPYILPTTSVTDRFREPADFVFADGSKISLLSPLVSNFENRGLFVGQPTKKPFEIKAAASGKLRWNKKKDDTPIEWTLLGCKSVDEEIKISEGVISWNGQTLSFEDYCNAITDMVNSRQE